MAPPPPMAQPALPPMREVTEDTPPDMLAGAMDLRVLLPDGHAVKMNVDRSTPMMDLLVHVTTANKMSPGSHVIQAVGEKGNILPYKPSTPIGALDTWTIQIVSKAKANVIGHKKAPFKPSNKPFEQTFRLQVNLPRNQLFVTRVSPRTPLLEVLRHVCSEKGLDPDKYELRNPMNPEEVLRLTCNLLDYKLQEVTVALRGSTTSHSHHSHHRVHPTSAADIISLQQQHQQLAESSEKRRKSSGSTTATSSHSGGVFGFIFKRSSRSSVCEGSISSDSLGGQSISPARSDESLGPARSASPPLSQTTSRTSNTQDHLRNQINSRMNRRQENSCCPVSVLKESGEQMEENQPPPPPVRQRKRRAPKPPVQHQTEVSSGSKKTSEFITPDPPSTPAPIPVSRRKSTSVEDEEYNEEVGRSVSGGRKVKIESGGTSGTVISHSRNSSDSSGYHEASVLSESPESGLGGSGAPDTLPRRKPQNQLQQQRAAASASSQIPAFSRSMGNLASVAPPPSSTSSSNTLISTSYSSLSISTSSLPSQKKKKAPAPPPPASSKKQQINEELNASKTASSISLFERTRHDSYKEEIPQLDRETVQKPKLNNSEASEPSKPDSIMKQKESSSLHVNLSVSSVDQKTNASLAVLPPVVAPLASKPASASKLGPAVAPKPKVNSMGKPGLNSSDNEAGETSEAAREEDICDFVNKTDVLHIQENLNDVANKSLGVLEIKKKLEDYDTVKENGVCTVLPSPPPSLEYMGSVDGVAQEEKGEGTYEDLEWEYKLPAPPTGFEDEEERTAEEVKEDTWVAESASIPSTFSSSHQKVWVVEREPLNHLPNFKMRTSKAPSSEGWEDPREISNENNLEKRSGSMFAMLNSDNIEREADREVDKNYLETWASVSSRSSVTSAPSSSVHTFNVASHTNSGYKDGVRGEKNRMAKNGSYVVRVSSFGGKSSMNLKRSLSSTSSIFSRHNETNGKDVAEKLDKESVASVTIKSSNGNEGGGQSLSNASRTVSLHDLAVNATEEESVSLTNGYHKENTTPKIVSSTWKKPQGGDPPGKYPSPVSHNLRKTSSELSISQAGLVNGCKGDDDEDQKVVRLQQQFLHWHEQMLVNKSTLDGSVSLKSLQVLRGVLPQLKKSLSSDLADKDVEQTNMAKRKESDQGKTDISGRMENGRDEGEMLHSLSTNTESTFAPRSNNETSSIETALQEAPKRYSYAGPPSINFGTWSERPKSEVSLKCDSDYRIGVGQATRAKEPSVHIAQNVNKSIQTSQHEPTPPCPPPKPSNHIVVNVVSAAKQEPISRLPIVRSVEFKKTSTLTRTDRPLSGSFLNDLREELTGALASLIDANRNGMAEEGNERKRRQQIPSSAVPPPPPDVTSVVRPPNQTTGLRRLGSTAGAECGPRLNGYGGNEKRHTIAPVVKGFRVNSVSATNVTNNQCQPPQPPPVPLPPPAVVCGVALKKKPELSTIPKFSENPRDQLLMAIREFGGRESLKKTAINYK